MSPQEERLEASQARAMTALDRMRETAESILVLTDGMKTMLVAANERDQHLLMLSVQSRGELHDAHSDS